MIQVKFASPILSTFHTFDSFPNAPGLHFIYIYIHISRERFSSRTKWSLKKRRILQEDEKKPFDACVPFHRSSHKWSRPVYPGVQVTLCICGAPSPPVFAASRWFTSSIPRRILPILGSAVRAFASFDTPSCCRSTVWSSLFLPNLDVPGERLAYRKSGGLFAASVCNWTRAVSRDGGLHCREKSRRERESRSKIDSMWWA